MRSFIDNSAQAYGYDFEQRTMTKEDWMEQSDAAMDEKQTGGLADLIAANTSVTERANDFAAVQADPNQSLASQAEQAGQAASVDATAGSGLESPLATDSSAEIEPDDGPEPDYGLER